ncbi:hypothetical protein K0817_016900 [Microbacterium sp. HD4P20]|uniref:hypothetical protein n=1 Tax=Microbacterium sp. HD4P20 TaxID=2864874 RepID=UPI0020A5B397|nr:hypothetical protein [Microbacterium sp. HD4P20]MCP2638234.1 hypothetical protein [Microbacterium sp. HD4P20]
MDQGAVDTDAGRAGAPRLPSATAPAATPPSVAAVIQPPRKRRRRARLALDLVALGIVGLLLVAAVPAAWGALERQFYSPAAFVERYVAMLADGDAAEALAVPGVTVSSAELEAAGLPPTADEALLREAALAPLRNARVVGAEEDGDITRVTVEYDARGYPGSTTFEVERDGSIGLAPTWRFATSPLAVMNLQVAGSMTFDVNGFTIDKRQVSPDGPDADPMAPVPLLVFSPGLYSVSVDTAISSTPGVAVLSDIPFDAIPVQVQAQATDEFVAVVQEEVEKFLTSCTTQEVLQPTACPFGYFVQDRIDSLPKWSIAQQPTVEVVPDGAGWRITPAEAVAHIDVEIRSLFDGKVRPVSEDVPFIVKGSITVQPDGRVSIVVTGPDTR